MTTRRHKGKSPVLRIGLVGLGVVAQKHLKAIDYAVKRGLAELVAVAEPDAERRQALAQSHPAAKAYESLKLLLAGTECDLVAITTPSGSHYALAREALAQGCHLLIEKPLTLSLAEADELLRLAREKEKQIAVGHIYRYFPLADRMKAIVSDGVLGKVLYGDVKVRWGHDQAYYDQAAWRGRYATDGGVLMNQTIHALDLMQWLIARPTVSGTAMLARQCHDMEAEDLALGILRFEGDVFLQVQGTTNSDPTRHQASFSLILEKGSLQVSLDAGRLSVDVRDGQRKRRGLVIGAVLDCLRGEGPGILSHLGNPHTFLYLDVLRALVSGGSIRADGQSGREALAAVLTLYRAARESQEVSVASAAAFPITDMHNFFSTRAAEEDEERPEGPE